jgi:hypothetical protein
MALTVSISANVAIVNNGRSKIKLAILCYPLGILRLEAYPGN